MTDERPGRGSTMERTSSTEELGAGGLAGVTILRIIAALAVPIVSFVVLWLTSNSSATPRPTASCWQ